MCIRRLAYRPAVDIPLTLYGPWRGSAFARARIQPLLEFDLIEICNRLPGAKTCDLGAAQAIGHRRRAAAHGARQSAPAAHPAQQAQPQ